MTEKEYGELYSLIENTTRVLHSITSRNKYTEYVGNIDETVNSIINANYRKADEVIKETAQKIINDVWKCMLMCYPEGIDYDVLKQIADEYGVKIEVDE